MDLLVGDSLSDGRLLHFQPTPMLLLVAAIWVWIAQYVWEARTWSVHRSNWRGALVQATITSFYLALVFCFLYGVVNVIWSWRLERPLSWPALESALRFGRNWLPYLYALGVSGVFVALFLDARVRGGALRLFHVGFALTFLIIFCMFLPYLCWQFKHLDEMIQYAQKQQK